MYDPKKILTESGYEEYMAHLNNIKRGLEYIMSNVDDLHIGATNSDQEDMLNSACYNFFSVLDVLKTGDGETDSN